MAEFGRADAALWRRAAPVVDELLELDPGERLARLETIAREDPEAAGCVRAWLVALEAEDLRFGAADGLVDALFAAGETQIARSGERVGPFRLLREIGRGGMGAVYAAERIDGGFAQQVAVKILKAGLDTEQVLRRFLAERRILARLEHPHIARLIDGGATEDGLPWFAMELVEGRPITQSASSLDLQSRLKLVLELCDAVAFAHANGVIHRDIKPSNVLVDARGQVKLLDFGIAKLLDPAEESLTRSAVRLMTPQFAAPEQETGGAVTVATDVWQVGHLLRQLAADTPAKDLDRVIARATHEDPARRYPSVSELADDVRRVSRGESVMARGDSLSYRIRRAVQRPRVAASLAALVVLAVLGIGAAKLYRAGAYPESAPLRFQLVSTFPGSHRQATFSPDGESIAFLMEDAQGTPQVWTKSLGGGDPVQRTFDPRGAHRPRWSRNDVIFYDVPAGGIWSIPARDGAARQVLPEGFNVNLSPDGTQIVYEVDSFLWTARPDGTGARKIGAIGQTIAKEYAFIESTPSFSPDGREVTYFQDRDSPIQGDIWAVTLASGDKRQLTFDDVDARHPVWMPDGSGVVFSSGRRGGLTLWQAPATGGEPRPLTTGTGEDSEAAISADGRRLIYTNARNLLRIMWLDPATNTRRQLFETRAVATHPSFSPDGSRVAFFHGQPKELRLAIVGADGTGMRDLTDGTPATVLPEWSRDGRSIHYYVNTHPSSFNRIATEGGPPQILIPGWRFMTQHGAHVSPDNTKVAYTLLSQGSAVETRVRNLASGAEYTLSQPILWPRWSPDGTQLAGRRATERQLVVCPASRAACRPLNVSGTEPRWSGDGRHLYYVTYAGYQGSRDPRAVPLWKVALDGSNPVHIADLEGPSPINFFYDVSSTGTVSWAAFVPGRQELWMTSLR